jgi:hypothetical protein
MARRKCTADLAEGGDEGIVGVEEIGPDSLGRGVEERRGRLLGLRRALVRILAANVVRSQGATPFSSCRAAGSAPISSSAISAIRCLWISAGGSSQQGSGESITA